MTVDERIAYAQANGVNINGPAVRAAALQRARNPWAARVEDERRAKERAWAPIARYWARIEADRNAASAAAFARGITEGTRLPPAPLVSQTAEDAWAERVERRRRNGTSRS